MIIADIRANIHGWNSRERLGKQNASENAFGSLSCTVRKRYTRCHYWTQPANAPAVYLSETIPRNFASDAGIRAATFSQPWRKRKTLEGSSQEERKKERKRILARSESKIYLDYCHDDSLRKSRCLVKRGRRKWRLRTTLTTRTLLGGSN